MLKHSENPPILPAGTGTLRDLPGQWWVGHTKARFEKVFAWDLLRHDIGYFLPLREQVTVSGGRKRRVLKPLFPSYVFFAGTEEDRYTAMATNRLCQAIEVIDQQVLIDELASIEAALKDNVELDLYPFAAVGQRCRITAGAFQGVEGVVVERGKSARLVLEVSILGQGAVMEIDADLLEPIHEA